MKQTSSKATILRLLVLLVVASPAYGDVYSSSAWKQTLSDKKKPTYEQVKAATEHFIGAEFPQEDLAVKYCSDWSSGQKKPNYLVVFDKVVLGGLSVVPDQAKVHWTSAEFEKEHKARLTAEGGKSLSYEISGNPPHMVKIARKFSLPDLGEFVYTTVLKNTDGKRWRMDIAVPQVLLESPAYQKMVNISVDSARIIDRAHGVSVTPYKYSLRKSNVPPRETTLKVSAADVDKQIAGLSTKMAAHRDDVRGFVIDCPPGTTFIERNKFRFDARDEAILECKNDLCQITLTGSNMYSGETLDSAVNEAKERLDPRDCTLSSEFIQCTDTIFCGHPGKKLIMKTADLNSSRPLDIRTIYIGIANGVVYRLECVTPEPINPKMQKMFDTMAASMIVSR